MDWLISRMRPDGTSGAAYTPTSPGGIIEFGWNTTPGNTCLEGFITADPSQNDLAPRDVVRILTTPDGVTYRSQYTGIVTTAGDQHGTEPVEYTLRPLDIRMHEIALPIDEITGDDVAEMVKSALASITLPKGVSGYRAPLLNFEMGDRYPAFETVAEFLDAMRDATGAFIVPAGSTYTYEGTTYNPGETVPATLWGVVPQDPFAAVYQLVFRRPQLNAVSLDVRTDPVKVEWDRVTGEEVFDRATLIYAAEIADGDTFKYVASGGTIGLWTAGTPIARTFGAGDYEATRIVPLSAPLEYMTDVAAVSVNSTWTNVGNAFDNDIATFAQASVAGANELTAVATGYQEAVARVDFAKALADDVFSVQLYWYDGVDTIATIYYDVKGENTTERQIVLLPALKPAGIDVSAADLYARVLANDNAKVYRLELMVPDVDEGGDASSKLAQGYMQGPAPAGGRVILYEPLDPANASPDTLNLTLADGSTVELPVGRIEHRMSREDGFVATYHIGSERDPSLIAERVVLERIAERAQS